MTHREFIKNNYNVIAENEKGILFDACGERCCEINGKEFICNSVQEFNELIKMFGNETWEE